MKWWANLLTFNSVVFMITVCLIFGFQLIQDIQLLTSFENAGFIGGYKYFPWYLWVAISQLVLTSFVCIMKGFNK